MKYLTIFHLISSVCKNKNVSCVLIGGFALNHYKVSRQTADVDFLITNDDYKKIAPLLEEEGYEQEYVQEVFVRFTAQKSNLMNLDFMFVDKQTLDAIIHDGKEVIVAEQKCIVPSVHHLIALKLHAIKNNPKAREFKDFLDIGDLIRTNKIDINDSEFKNLCLQYGTEELYKKIVSWVA